MHHLVACWPGLPGLWYRGELRGLALALIFGVLLQAAIFTNLIWPELLHPASGVVVCFGAALFWLSVVWGQWAQIPAAETRHAEADTEHLFRSAQDEYLKGNWFQAETLWRRLLDTNAEDVEARLYLVSLYRRIGHSERALSELEWLESCPNSQKWHRELQNERWLLAERQEGNRRSQQQDDTAVDAA